MTAPDAPRSPEELRRCLERPADIYRDPDVVMLAKAREVLLGKSCLGGCGETFAEALHPVVLVYARPFIHGLCVDCADAFDDDTVVRLQTEHLQRELASMMRVRQTIAELVAEGELVALTDANGKPVLRNGEQVYVHRGVGRPV